MLWDNDIGIKFIPFSIYLVCVKADMRRGHGVAARGDSVVRELSRFTTYSDTRGATRRLSDMQIVPGLLSSEEKTQLPRNKEEEKEKENDSSTCNR